MKYIRTFESVKSKTAHGYEFLEINFSDVIYGIYDKNIPNRFFKNKRKNYILDKLKEYNIIGSNISFVTTDVISHTSNNRRIINGIAEDMDYEYEYDPRSDSYDNIYIKVKGDNNYYVVRDYELNIHVTATNARKYNI